MMISIAVDDYFNVVDDDYDSRVQDRVHCSDIGIDIFLNESECYGTLYESNEVLLREGSYNFVVVLEAYVRIKVAVGSSGGNIYLFIHRYIKISNCYQNITIFYIQNISIYIWHILSKDTIYRLVCPH
jgi:hypothetical protein